MKQKPAILRGPYPTVEDTARLLGVSQRRLTGLLRLVDSNDILKERKDRTVLAAHKVSGAKGKRAATKKRIASASRKRRTRGQTAEAHS